MEAEDCKPKLVEATETARTVAKRMPKAAFLLVGVTFDTIVYRISYDIINLVVLAFYTTTPPERTHITSHTVWQNEAT
jgi:hypothetical protein